MQSLFAVKSLYKGFSGYLGTVAAKTEVSSENGPHPIKFFALYLNLCSLPLMMPQDIVYVVTRESISKPIIEVYSPLVPSSICNSQLIIAEPPLQGTGLAKFSFILESDVISASEIGESVGFEGTEALVMKPTSDKAVLYVVNT